MKPHYIISLGRQLGSGGKEIGERLSQLLGVTFYDKELIQLAANQSGLCKELFEKADEQTSKGFWGSVFAPGIPLLGDTTSPYMNCLNDDSLFQIQGEVIRQIAQKEPAIFVGRCADYILRNRENTINLFISAPLEFRINRIVTSTTLSHKEAEELIHKVDKQRSSYYNYYTYKEWGAAASYHLCVDSSLLGVEGTADFLLEFINKVRS